jgi:hypothetical protein
MNEFLIRLQYKVSFFFLLFIPSTSHSVHNPLCSHIKWGQFYFGWLKRVSPNSGFGPMVYFFLVKLFADHPFFYRLSGFSFTSWVIIQNTIKNMISSHPFNVILRFIARSFICNIKFINALSKGLTSCQLNNGMKIFETSSQRISSFFALSCVALISHSRRSTCLCYRPVHF